MSVAYLSLATFNVWHGLAGRGTVRFREFENASRREERWRLAGNCVSELASTSTSGVVFLQELNPVSVRGAQLAARVGGEFTGRVDQGGIKIMGRGWPLNLATGLGVLLHGEVAGRWSDEGSRSWGRQLSGSGGFSGEKFSLHMGELRYSQFVPVDSSEHGRVLCVNAHLHHGFERFSELLRLLNEAVESGAIEARHRDDLMPHLDAARDRRLREIDRLLNEIGECEAEYDGIVVAGDFNAPSEAAAYQAMLLAGFKDLHATFGSSKNVENEPTWDPAQNRANHGLQDSFQFPLPSFDQPAMQAIYRGFDLIPRRIDFIFARGSLIEKPPYQVERFGFVDKTAGFAPSDHYGVVARWGDAPAATSAVKSPKAKQQKPRKARK